LPFRIAAIVFASQVNGKLQAGDYAGAVEVSDKAKKLVMIGFFGGNIVNLIVGGLQVAAIGMN
jgi:hypothetical protein